MDGTLLQIYDYVPKELKKCVESAKSIAKKLKFEYQVIKPDFGKEFFYKSSCSDYIRLEQACKTKNLLIADWDILFNKDFEIGGKKAQFGNSINNLIWTGEDLKLFEDMFDVYNSYKEDHKNYGREKYRVWKIMKTFPQTNSRIDINTYYHLKFSKINKNSINKCFKPEGKK